MHFCTCQTVEFESRRINKYSLFLKEESLVYQGHFSSLLRRLMIHNVAVISNMRILEKKRTSMHMSGIFKKCVNVYITQHVNRTSNT
jgi:hypothetical protein